MVEVIARHGAAAVFAGAFLEFVGLPVPSAPLLLYVGALAGSSPPGIPLLVVAAAAGAVLGDTIWFAVGSTHGERLVRLYCKLSLGSRACTQRTESFFRRLGLRSLLFAKFVPGLSTFAAPMAGRSGASVAGFWAWDAAGSIGWAGALILAGSLLGKGGVAAVRAGLDSAGSWITWLVLALAAGVLVFKVLRRLKHGAPREHELRGPPDAEAST